MATHSFDPRGLIIDGKRVHLVSGTLPYARIPRGLWRKRLLAAKQAGLNAVSVPVHWARHEPREGRFDFAGENDLGAFLREAGALGLRATLELRPDAPDWLAAKPGVRVRQLARHGEPNLFMDAAAKWYARLFEEVGKLQAPTGPVVLAMVESSSILPDPSPITGAYVRELARYLREAGCVVTLCHAHPGMQGPAEGVFEAATLELELGPRREREMSLERLASRQPAAPLLAWAHGDIEPGETLATLCGILAVGGQFNHADFQAGPPGVLHGSLTVAGEPTRRYAALKRVATFASQFPSLFTQVDRPQHASLLSGIRVLHARSRAGQVVFVLLPEALDGSAPAPETHRIGLPDGKSLEIAMGTDRAAWIVLDMPLGVAKLDYTNLRPWAFVGGKTLVLFGPAGSEGIGSIHGARTKLTVPTGQEPLLIDTHHAIRLVVLNHEQVDAAYLRGDSIVVGCAGLDEAGQPLPLEGWKHVHVLGPGAPVRQPAPKPVKPGPLPKLDWRVAAAPEMDPAFPGYRDVAGDRGLHALADAPGSPYGFYRVSLPKPVNGAIETGWDVPSMAIFNGDPRPVRASDVAFRPFHAAGDLVVLASRDDTPSGLAEGLNLVVPAKLAASAPVTVARPDAQGLGADVLASSHCVAFAYRFRAAASPMRLQVATPFPAIVELDGKVVGVVHAPTAKLDLPKPRGGAPERRLRILVCLPAWMAAPTARLLQLRQVAVYSIVEDLAAPGRVAFAPFRQPPAEAFGRSRAKAGRKVLPRWFRAEFKLRSAAAPLWLDVAGLGQGHVWLNGHDVGGFDAQGDPVIFLPECWLLADAPNTLVVFDEGSAKAMTAKLTHASPDAR